MSLLAPMRRGNLIQISWAYRLRSPRRCTPRDDTTKTIFTVMTIISSYFRHCEGCFHSNRLPLKALFSIPLVLLHVILPKVFIVFHQLLKGYRPVMVNISPCIEHVFVFQVIIKCIPLNPVMNMAEHQHTVSVVTEPLCHRIMA